METSKDIEDNIAKLEADINPINDKLDNELNSFSKELVNEVEAWMKKELSRKIEDNAETVNAGGLEPLRMVKADFNSLVEKLPVICEKAIGEKESWPHYIKKNASRSSNAKRNEPYFAAIFRKAINPLGSLLETHALLSEPKGHVASWKKITSGEFEYAINPGFRESEFKSIHEYNSLRKRHAELVIEVDKKQKELAKAKARELWNEA